jgi:hypothetical protein
MLIGQPAGLSGEATGQYSGDTAKSGCEARSLSPDASSLQ